MKATKVLGFQYKNEFLIVTFENGESYNIYVPDELQRKPPEVKIRKGKIYMGEYVYNFEKDKWEKVSKILRFLLAIVEAIKDIF